MKKTLFTVLGLIFCVSLTLLGCKQSVSEEPDNQNSGDIITDENGTTTTENEATTDENGTPTENETTQTIELQSTVKFNTSNAKTLALVDRQNSSYRSMARDADDSLANAMIVKIMEDGSLENFMEVPEGSYISQIQEIYQSPYDDAKEIYLRFEGESSYYETVQLNGEYGTYGYEESRTLFGCLLCINADGSYYDILRNSDGSYKNFSDSIPLVFDSSNCMYFVGSSESDWSSSIVYRFDPSTGVTVPLTPAVPNTWYDKLQLTGDGQWLLVQGYGPNSSFLRAIPVVSPDNFVNIVYRSDSNGCVDQWLYSEQSKCLYYIIYSQIYKLPYENGTFDVSKRIDYSTEIPTSLDLIENRIEYMWPETQYGTDVITKEIVLEESQRTYQFKDTEDTDVINYQEILDYYKSEIWSWLTDDAVLSFNPDDYEIRFDTIIENLTNGNIKYGGELKNTIDSFIEKVQNKKELELIKTIVDENLFNTIRSYIITPSFYIYEYYEDGYCYKNNVFADIMFEKSSGKKINTNLFKKNKNNYYLNKDNDANNELFSSVWTWTSEYDSDLGYYVDIRKMILQKSGVDFSNITTKNTYGYREFTLYDKESNQINATEIVNYIKSCAYSSMSDNKRSEFEANEYEIRFDYFKNISGYEKLASKTKGKSDEAAIKIISADNELMYLCYKIFELHDWSILEGVNIYKEILYKKGTTKKISKTFFSDNNYSGFGNFVLTKTPCLMSYKDDIFDPSILLDSLARACGKTKDQITFSLEFFKDEEGYEDLYTTLRDEQAIEFLEENADLSLLIDYIKPKNYYGSSDEYTEKFSCDADFLRTTCFKKGTNETAYTLNEVFDSTFFSGWGRELIQSTGKSIFYMEPANSSGTMTFIELYNKEGDHTGKDLTSQFSDKKIIKSNYDSNGLCLLIALTVPGTQDEIGKHQLYYYDINNDSVKNLFENIANNNNYEIYAFSVGAGKVYFNAVCGMSLIIGNIDLQTGVLSQNNTTLKLTQIITLH